MSFVLHFSPLFFVKHNNTIDPRMVFFMKTVLFLMFLLATPWMFVMPTKTEIAKIINLNLKLVKYTYI